MIEDRLVTVHEHRLLGNGQQLISSQRRLHEKDGFADAAHIDLEVRPLDQPTACHDAIIGPTPVIPAQIMQLDEALAALASASAACRAGALGFRHLRPSPPVRIRIRSASNSATIASTLKSSQPTGSVGSWIDPPGLSFTFRLVGSSRATTSSRQGRRAADLWSAPIPH